jgi:hypothetical protein
MDLLVKKTVARDISKEKLFSLQLYNKHTDHLGVKTLPVPPAVRFMSSLSKIVR